MSQSLKEKYPLIHGYTRHENDLQSLAQYVDELDPQEWGGLDKNTVFLGFVLSYRPFQTISIEPYRPKIDPDRSQETAQSDEDGEQHS